MSTHAATVPADPRSRALRYTGVGLLWVASVLLGLGFLAGGWSKFDEFWVAKFVDYGYPAWFAYVVGIAEMIGGVMLVIPRVAAPGAALLAFVMLGATGTHLWYGEMNWSFTSILMAIFVTIAMTRRRRVIVRRT